MAREARRIPELLSTLLAHSLSLSLPRRCLVWLGQGKGGRRWESSLRRSRPAARPMVNTGSLGEQVVRVRRRGGPGEGMSAEDILHGWTVNNVEEEEVGQELKVVEEDQEPGQLGGGEVLEAGQEEGEDQVEEGEAGDGPGREGVGVVSGDPHVGHGQGEEGPAESHWSRLCPGKVAQDVGQVVYRGKSGAGEGEG